MASSSGISTSIPFPPLLLLTLLQNTGLKDTRSPADFTDRVEDVKHDAASDADEGDEGDTDESLSEKGAFGSRSRHNKFKNDGDVAYDRVAAEVHLLLPLPNSILTHTSMQ